MAKLLGVLVVVFAICCRGFAAVTIAAELDSGGPLPVKPEATEAESKPAWLDIQSNDDPSAKFVDVIPGWLSDDPAAPRKVLLVPSTLQPAAPTHLHASAESDDRAVATPVPRAVPTPAREVREAKSSPLTVAPVGAESMTVAGVGSLTEEPSGEPKEETPLIEGLLREAQQALNKGNLIEPTHNNAYDRYRSVLILDKNNRKARKGLQEILRRYSFLVKDAVDNNRLRRADALLRELARFYPGNDVVKQHQRTLMQVRRQQESQAVANVGKKVAATEDISLPLVPLDKRSDELLGLLSEIVVRLIESDESILIYARTDAEGRWIYSQMKRLSAGYRIRGDIRISSNPRISVLPPL